MDLLFRTRHARERHIVRSLVLKVDTRRVEVLGRRRPVGTGRTSLGEYVSKATWPM